MIWRSLRGWPGRVEAGAGEAVLAAQEAVERGFDAALADAVAEVVALHLLQLRLADLADVAEHGRRQLAAWIAAHLRLLDLHAGEVRLALGEEGDGVAGNVVLDRDRRQRVELLLLELLQNVRERHAEHVRQPLKLVAAVPPLGGQVRRPDADRRDGAVVDEQLSVAIEDLAAGRLDAHLAELVVARGAQVVVAGEHLQRPEPQDQQRERGERERAEDADPKRHLRREAVRLLHTRVARQEAARLGAVAAVSQRARPRGRSRSEGGGARTAAAARCTAAA